MRDINRIKPMLEKLGELWLLCPDLRLGQLLTNLNISAGMSNDCFFIEDDKMLKQIEKELHERKFKE